MLKEKAVKKDNKKGIHVKRKGCKKDNNNKEKDSDDSKNVNNNDDNNDNDNDKVDNNNDNDKDKDKDNLIDKLLNNKDKLHNFSDKVLNNLINIAKLKEKILINRKKVEEINIPKKDIRSKLDKYKKINILNDDLINHIWRMIYGENRVNNEIDNIDCDINEDVKSYAIKYMNIVTDKQILIYAVSESIDELIQVLMQILLMISR